MSSTSIGFAYDHELGSCSAQARGGTGFGEIPETHNLLCGLHVLGQAARELCPGANAELRVRVLEVHLDGPHADGEGLRDLFVRQPVRGELDDASLGGREVAARIRATSADEAMLRARVIGPPGGA